MQIARAVSHCTRATPVDELVFTTPTPHTDLPYMDEIHVSVTFTYDIPKAEQIAKAW